MVMRMRNFQYIDPKITGEGKKGLSHTAKTDKEIFKEFQNEHMNGKAARCLISTDRTICLCRQQVSLING